MKNARDQIQNDINDAFKHTHTTTINKHKNIIRFGEEKRSKNKMKKTKRT